MKVANTPDRLATSLTRYLYVWRLSRHPQSILIADIDLVLRGPDLVVVVLDGNTHRFQREHRSLTNVVAPYRRG